MNEYILKSIETFLKTIPNLYMFIYQDSKFDLTTTYRVHSKINLPLGSETTFILVDNDDGLDFKSTENDFLLHRYIEFISPTTAQTKYIPIISYNKATGQVILGNSFGEAIEITDVFNLVILDALYISNGGGFQSFIKANATEENLNIYLYLQTKEDSKKSKMFDYMYRVKHFLNKAKKRLAIYDETSAICGYMKILSQISENEMLNDDVQLQKYMMSFVVSYTMNYLKKL